MGVGRVCLFKRGGVVRCIGTDGLVSGPAFVGVIWDRCSGILARWEPAYSGVQLARLGVEVKDGSPEFELPLWSLADAPSAPSSALALSSHFPLTVSTLFGWVYFIHECFLLNTDTLLQWEDSQWRIYDRKKPSRH